MRHQILSGLLFLLLTLTPLLAADAPTVEDWSQFRGPRGDGISTETGLRSSWSTDGPVQSWRRTLGEGFSGLTVVGNRIYTMYASGEGTFATALDAENGETHWRSRIDAKWVDRFGNGPRSTPTVEANRVFVLSGRGALVALSIKDGSELWRVELAKQYGAEPPRWGVSTSPIVDGDLLVVVVGGSGGRGVVGFDKKTGKQVWASFSDRAGYAAPVVFEAAGIRQVVTMTAGNVVALAPGDGKLLWSLPWETSYDVNAASPLAVGEDRMFISSGYDKGGAMLRIRSVAGKVGVQELWRNREMKNQFSSSVYHDGYLYGFDDKTLKCIDAETGETRWRQRGLGHGSLVYADGKLFALGDAGRLVMLRATPEKYEELGGFQPFEGKTWSVPTLHGGRMFVRDEKQIAAYRIAE